MEIKTYIDMYKQEHRLSDRKLASIIGVGEPALNKWRHGVTPKGDNLRLLLNVLNVDIADVTFPSDTGPQASTHGRQSKRVSDGEPVPQEA